VPASVASQASSRGRPGVTCSTRQCSTNEASTATRSGVEARARCTDHAQSFRRVSLGQAVAVERHEATAATSTPRAVATTRQRRCDPSRGGQCPVLTGVGPSSVTRTSPACHYDWLAPSRAARSARAPSSQVRQEPGHAPHVLTSGTRNRHLEQARPLVLTSRPPYRRSKENWRRLPCARPSTTAQARRRGSKWPSQRCWLTRTRSCGSTRSRSAGTDLHILKGDVPAVTDGRILGHEAVGTVEAVGSG
jgi:hypothetical protein